MSRNLLGNLVLLNSKAEDLRSCERTHHADEGVGDNFLQVSYWFMIHVFVVSILLLSKIRIDGTLLHPLTLFLNMICLVAMRNFLLT